MPELLDILGQDAALARLQRLLAGDRRPHACIFAGCEGVGRRTTAVEFAKVLLCPHAVERPNGGRLALLPRDFPLRAACGRCNSCRTAAAGTNPDLHVVYKELARYHDDEKVRERVMQELGIAVVRQFLIAPAAQASTGGRGKVFVVLQADLMSDDAQNALLKTLEEPPAGVTIILICGEEADLLPTVRSRCQVVRFGLLPAEIVVRALADAGVEQTQRRFWADLSAGSVGEALRLSGLDLYDFKRRLLTDLAALTPEAEKNLATALRKKMDNLADKFKKADDDLAPTLAGRQAGQILLALLTSVYRDALTVACSAGRALVHADQADEVRRIARRFDAPTLAEILQAMSACEQLLWRNVNPKILWDNVAVTCSTGTPLEV